MKRLLVLALIAFLIIPSVPTHATTTGVDQAPHKPVAIVYPYEPHINVTRVIDLSYGYLANVTDVISINSTKPFNAFTFALPEISMNINATSDNGTVGIIPGKTFTVNGTRMKRITLVLDNNVTSVTFNVTFYFFNVFTNDTYKGTKPSEKDAFAIVEFTTVPISKYTYDYVRLNVTFPPRSKPMPELSTPSDGNVSLTTLYRRFENYTGSLPGMDLRAVAETERLPYVVRDARMTIQFTTGSEVYVKLALDYVVFGNIEYSGPFTSDEPKSAVRYLYVYLPRNISEIKVYDDLGIVVNYTKYPWGDYYRREIRTRTPLVGNLSTYHLTIYYKLNVSMGIKAKIETRTPYIPALIERFELRVLSPPFGALASMERITEPDIRHTTGSRHLPVTEAHTVLYNVTFDLNVRIVAYRSLMTYVGMPIIGAIILVILSALTLYLISLVPAPERVEKELPEDVKNAIEVLEELASIAPTVLSVIEKPMKLEERIRTLENIRVAAEKKLQEAISAVNKVSDPETRELLIVIAGIGASIVSAIRRLEDIERIRAKMTKSVYLAAIAEASTFIDSAYKRMMAMLVNLKL